jgi:hypothetical protein
MQLSVIFEPKKFRVDSALCIFAQSRDTPQLIIARSYLYLRIAQRIHNHIKNDLTLISDRSGNEIDWNKLMHILNKQRWDPKIQQFCTKTKTNEHEPYSSTQREIY